MSYSSLLSLAASGESSSSLEIMTSQFAQFHSGRKEASITTSSSPTSNSIVETALLNSNGRHRDKICAKLAGPSVSISTLNDASNSQIIDSYRLGISNFVGTASSSVPSHSSDNEFSVSATSGSTAPISSSTGSSTPVSSTPVTSLFAPADALTVLGSGSMETGSGAGKNLLPALTKTDFRQSGELKAKSDQTSIRVETVEWHMLDKRKFYPMSTSCSFMIRGMLYPFTLIKTRIQVRNFRLSKLIYNHVNIFMSNNAWHCVI